MEKVILLIWTIFDAFLEGRDSGLVDSGLGSLLRGRGADSKWVFHGWNLCIS